MDPISTLAEKVVAPVAESFLKKLYRSLVSLQPESARERLALLRDQLDRGGVEPSFVASKLNSVIRDHLNDVQKLVDRQGYYEFRPAIRAGSQDNIALASLRHFKKH